MERSCSAYTSSLRSGERQARLPPVRIRPTPATATPPTAGDEKRPFRSFAATPSAPSTPSSRLPSALAGVARPAHAPLPAPLDPDAGGGEAPPASLPEVFRRGPPSLLNFDVRGGDDDDKRRRPQHLDGSVPAVVSQRAHCERHRAETPPRPLPFEGDLLV